jgi:hypothetical protein
MGQMAFPDVEELIMAIGDYIDRHNQNPRQFSCQGERHLGKSQANPQILE